MTQKILEKKAGEITLEIEVGKEKLEEATKLVVEELAKTVKIDGFRPGKAPLFMLEKEIGSDRLWAEVMDKVIPESYFEAIVAEKVSPISAPEVAVLQFVPHEKLVFTAKVALMPEIKDFKYKDLKIKENKVALTNKEKKEALEDLLKRSPEEVEVERAAKKDDKVEIDFEGFLNNVPFEGGQSRNHPLVLGSGSFVPGFEEQLEGKKAGEEFEIEVTFPKDYHAANLAGQKVKFKVKLNKVYEINTPKADDEFAKKFNLENLKALEDAIEKEMTFEKELAERRRVEEDVMNKILEKNKIEAPELIVHEEIHRMMHEAEHNLSHSGLTMDKFLEMTNKKISDLEEEMKPEAEKRVKIGIVLGEVAKAEEIKAEDKEVEAEIDRIVAMAEGNAEDVKAAYEMPERKREIANQIVVRKSLEKLWEYNVQKSDK